MIDVAERLPESALRRQVLTIVAELAAERHELARPVLVSTDTSLERDLGLFSLERAELVLRLEAATGRTFEPAALDPAATVGDVMQLAAGESPAPRNYAAPAAVTSVSDGEGVPSIPFTVRVAVVLALVSVGLRLRLVTRPGVSASRRALRRAARVLLRAAGAVPSVRGLDNLDGQLPAVLLANHQSYVDTAVLLGALPVDVLLVGNERLRDAPLLRTAIKTAGYLVVDRTTPAGRSRGVSEMTTALREGHTLLVFPEGTIEAGLAPGRFRLGAFAAAVQTGRPVLPVTVRGTRQVLPLGRWTLGRWPLCVTVHPPLLPTGSGWAETVRLAQRTREVIAKELAAPGSGALGVHGRSEPHQCA
jgi:1-acyl-sn-glycerol-3-phosphate acyltransferase